MKRHILAWAASAALVGAVGAAPAMADDSGATQALGQSAANQQSANSDATSTQVAPSNQNISVRVLSPGNDGPVTQTNSSQALSAAGNLNSTSQDASQTQGGGGTQAADQTAASQQSADSTAASKQIKPSNQNISVRVLSSGDNGSVTQTNASEAGALAGNKNDTTQHADQSQGGGGGGTQAALQQAYNTQHASADAESEQIHPSNENIGVRVLSPGNDGSVKQTNSSGAAALAGNENSTKQDASQYQGVSRPEPSKDCRCDGDSTGIQALGQKAVNKQDASADATSEQIHPSNVNAPVRVGSPGDNGKVEQANVSFAGALAGNANETTQNAEQDQGGRSAPVRDCHDRCDDPCRDRCDDPCHDGCGHGSTAIQALGQQAYSDQKADADAESKQIGASNVNAPVRTGSPGGDGSVEQLNASGAESFAGNKNSTEQKADQDQGGGASGTAIQALGQDAVNRQSADSDATSEQICPVNLNAPVFDGAYGAKERKDGKDGKDGEDRGIAKPGSVKQSNLSWAKSKAGNKNRLMQWGKQRM